TKVPAKRRDLLRHAEVLGTALEHGTVLPLRFGVVFENATALVEDLLLPRYAELVQLLGRFEGRVELSVKAFFREEAILAELAQQQAERMHFKYLGPLAPHSFVVLNAEGR